MAPQRYVKLVHQKVVLLGIRVLVAIRKVNTLKMRSSWIRMSLKHDGRCLIRDRKTQRHTERSSPCEDTRRDWNYAALSQGTPGCRQPPEVTRSTKEMLPLSFQGESTLWIL